MIFCDKCKNNMNICEINIDGVRNIYYNCNNCEFIKPTQQFKIYNKLYNNNINKDWVIDPVFSINDKTLPRKHTKCPSCKKINDNVYYQNKDLTIKLICNNCQHMWIYS
jgi:DNA-directed RNA polymerase subunit M/transcription elongation factor TFIIS